MKDYLQRTPFIRVLLPFLCGIMTESFVRFHPDRLFIILLTALFITLTVIVRRAGYIRDTLTGILFTLFFFWAGIYFTSEENKPPTFSEGTGYRAVLLEKPVEKLKSFKAEALITSLLSGDTVLKAHEKIIVYLGKSNKLDSLKPGSSIVFNQIPQEIENQGNPFEFDYKRYAALKNFHRQVYLPEKSWVFAGQHQDVIISITAEKIRDFLLDIYRRNGLQGTEFEILSALTLGYKKSMDPEIKQVFAAAGASHVLAVSGLHVGIVYLVFNLLFGFMRKNKHTRIFFVLLAVFFLWIFAFITGLSPSVQRSALMFTIVLIGENLRRPANIYNTLAASFFILTVVHPNIIFDVGFQLSYAAVFGIVYFQPRLFSLFTFTVKPVNYLWGLFTVSLAAQITTFPVSCYYFNQFPAYFWLSNFLVIPMAFVFIFLGIFILAISPFPVISGFLAKCAGLLVKLLYLSLQWIESLPGALLKDFSFPFPLLLITSGGIICLILFLETRQKRALMLLILLVTTGFLVSSGKKISQNLRREIIAYRADQPLLHLVYGRKNYLLAPEKILESDFPDWQVSPVIRHFGLEKPVLVAWENDYSDRILYKKGNGLCFDGIILWNQGNRNQTALSDPDIVITSLPIESQDIPAAKTAVVSYSKKNKQATDVGIGHVVQEKGAWRFSIRKGRK